jgi:hypothetical protein
MKQFQNINNISNRPDNSISVLLMKTFSRRDISAISDVHLLWNCPKNIALLNVITLLAITAAATMALAGANAANAGRIGRYYCT